MLLGYDYYKKHAKLYGGNNQVTLRSSQENFLNIFDPNVGINYETYIYTRGYILSLTKVIFTKPDRINLHPLIGGFNIFHSKKKKGKINHV